MKRIIPKPAKVRISFLKDLYVRDIIFLSISFLCLAIIAMSNIPGNWIILLILGAFALALFVVKVDERLYYEIFIALRFLTSKKNFDGNDQTAFAGIDNDVINFKGGYYAGVLELSAMEFFLLREEVQDSLIDGFSAIYKNMSLNQKVSLVKLDRPIILDEFVSDLDDKIKQSQEKAKLSILKTRRETLEKMNKIDNCCYYNAFYVVIYDNNVMALNQTLTAINSEFRAHNIKAKRLKNSDLLAFVKRTITQVFDEREVKDVDLAKSIDYVTPKNITFYNAYTDVDGIRESTYVINRYPVETFNAWATALCNLNFTKVVISATLIPTDKAIKQIDRSSAEIEERYSKSHRMSSRSENELHYSSMKYLVEELGNNNEVMLDTTITVTAYDYEQKGGEFRRNVRKTLNKLGFRSATMRNLQPEGYRASTLNMLAKPDGRVYSQGINSGSLSASFPFVASQIIEKGGVMLGENSAPVVVDFTKRGDEYKNSNVVVLGSVGAGKSFFAKTLFTSLYSDNMRLFVLDPENEYTMLANNVGALVIDMGNGGNIINPFAILSDVSGDDFAENKLLAHLTFLEEFFSATLSGLEKENLERVQSLLPSLYEKKGITRYMDFNSYDGEYPTFDDFLALIDERIENAGDEKYALKTIRMFVEKFATGGRYSFLWNGQTNLKANADFVVFNFQTLLANANKTIATAQMLLLTQYLNNELIQNYNRIRRGESASPIVIAIDEAHIFIDPDNPVALRFMKNTAKRCRKYNGMQVVLTQSVNDFLGGIELERESKAVITESQYTFVFPLNASSAHDFLKLYDKMDITDDESNAIMDNPRGSAFFIAHQRSRTNIRVVAPQGIRDLFERKVELPTEQAQDVVPDGETQE